MPVSPPPSTEQRRGAALVLLSTASYAALPILTKVAYAEGVRPSGVLAYRFVLAVALFAVSATRGAPRVAPRQRAALWGLGGAPDGAHATGVAFAFVAAVLYAGYIVLGSRVGAQLSAEATARHVAQASAVVFTTWAALDGGLALPPSPAAWASLSVLAVVSTVVAGGAAHAGPGRGVPGRGPGSPRVGGWSADPGRGAAAEPRSHRRRRRAPRERERCGWRPPRQLK